VGSVYRDRLAQISGRTPKEIISELQARTKIINVLIEKGINDIKYVTNFCRRYAINPLAAIETLGLKKESLFGGR
jgi:hypothetical protein